MPRATAGAHLETVRQSMRHLKVIIDSTEQTTCHGDSSIEFSRTYGAPDTDRANAVRIWREASLASGALRTAHLHLTRLEAELQAQDA